LDGLLESSSQLDNPPLCSEILRRTAVQENLRRFIDSKLFVERWDQFETMLDAEVLRVLLEDFAKNRNLFSLLRDLRVHGRGVRRAA